MKLREIKTLCIPKLKTLVNLELSSNKIFPKVKGAILFISELKYLPIVSVFQNVEFSISFFIIIIDLFILDFQLPLHEI